MKHFAFIFFLMAGALVQAQNQSSAIIEWEKSTHEFGDVIQGEKVEHVFKFTNTGTIPLVITNVLVTCGCTTPKGWPREPIAPGGKGEVTIQFDSKGKNGRQNKVATVVSNAVAGNSQVTFSVNVLEKR